jgi:glycosyltransferase involved in cell wall biosynthesis
MQMEQKTVIFVSHVASRTGAPLLLLNALQNMHDVQWDSRVLLLQDGPLRNRFSDLYPTVVQPKVIAKIPLKFFQKDNRQIPDLYYLNSHSYSYLHRAAHEGVPVICHVHEIPLSFAQVPEPTLELFRTYPTRYIVVSEYVRDMLVSDMGIPEDRIRHIPSGIDAQYWQRKTNGNSIREELCIPEDATVVGMSGQVIPLKGVDIWLQMAHRLCAEHPEKDWHFVWVGSAPPGGFVYEQLMMEEVKNLGLENCVHFVGEHEDPRPYYEMFDVFTLSSRMESLSLVCLENTVLGVPTVAVATAGGPREFGSHGFTHLITKSDPVELAHAVIRLMQNPEKCFQLTKQGADIIPKQYNILKTADMMKEEVTSVLHSLTPSLASV